MSSLNIGIAEAAKMLNITKSSLMLELEKPDCPYGFSYIPDGKRFRVYFVSRKHLQKWIEDHPNKYSDNPKYASSKILGLKYYSTQELIEELKTRMK